MVFFELWTPLMIGQHRHKTCTSVCFTFFYGRLSRLHSVLLIPPGSLFYVESRIVSIFLKSWHQAVQSRWGGQGVRHCVPTVYRVSRKPLLRAPWHHWTCTSFVILVSIWNVSAAILCFLVSPCKIWFLACSAHLLCQRLLLCSFVLLLWIFVHPIKLVKVLLLFLIVSAFGSTPTYWTLGPPDTVAEMPSWAPWVRPHHKPHSGKQPAPRPGSKVGPW